MDIKFIPIIGTISAGKSTFLRAFLGIDVLQTGQTTTTKFVCLIKNSPNISFYHVIPKNENGITLEKEGSETKTCEEIKKRIEEINEQLTKNKGTKNDIFYMLEIPIKNVNNETLLDKCYFMDIPGLNENNATYIDDIFSIITIDDILFEIMVFDSTSIGSDNILKIFQKLNDKNCLIKQGNLYILNKLDKCTTGIGYQEIIDNFKNYFYQAFEDEKKSDESKIEINFSENYFVPMNSILYQAETKFNEDFYSFLLIELFSYMETADKSEYTTFYDFIIAKLDCIMGQNTIKEESLEDVDEESEDMEIIKESINKLDDLKSDLNITNEFTIGIRLDKKKQKQVIKKLYMIHKLKLYENYIPSESFTKLQEIIKNFKLDDLGCPPSIAPVYQKDEEQKEDSILNEMNIFLKTQLKNQFGELNSYLRVLSENLLGRKIRISFIGNISVGKSTVLNSIIGENILPTSDGECTYRGIIVKHKNIDNFLLFRSKINEIGDGGLNKYYNFEEDKKPYCSGITNIQSYLKNKNNDKNMTNEDAFIVIQGKLKIFEFIKFDEELIEKIEFVDLPGHDRKNNKFNQEEFYDKILQFSNCCIYINEPKTVDDEDSVKRIQDQYTGDKQKLHHLLRPKFLSSCLFLINKSDSLSNKKEKRKIDEEKLTNSIIDTISKVEENMSQNKINISFFSGRCFIEFLHYYKMYVDILENRPLILLNHLYKKYSNAWFRKSFKDFINKEGEKIEEKLDFELEEVNAPSEFSNKLKSELNQLFNHKKIKLSEQEEIINTLYSINYTIKNKDFSDTNYSLSFFRKLKEIIIYSDNIQKENLKLSIQAFFQTADKLFERELKKETEIEKKKKEKRYNLLKYNIVPNAKNLLDDKEQKIKQIILNGKQKALEIIEDEINNAEQRIKDCDGNVKDAGSKLEQKIKEQINKMKKEQDEVAKTIIDDIINLSNENINTHYDSKDLSLDEIEAEKGKTKEIVISIVSSALGGIATTAGALFIGSSVAAGVAAGTMATTTLTTAVGALFGPLGIVAGLGVSALIGGISYIVYRFKKTSKYKEALSGCKNDIQKKFDDMLKAFIKDFGIFKNSLLNELDILCDVLYKKIDDNEIIKEWGKIKSEYEIIKERTKNIIDNKFN